MLWLSAKFNFDRFLLEFTIRDLLAVATLLKFIQIAATMVIE